MIKIVLSFLMLSDLKYFLYYFCSYKYLMLLNKSLFFHFILLHNKYFKMLNKYFKKIQYLLKKKL